MRSINDMNLDHSIKECCTTTAQYESLASNNERAGGWIEWNGGECPVASGTLIDFKYRDGSFVEGEEAGHQSWSDCNESDDIIAWRLHQPDQVAWNGEGVPPVGTECEMQDGKGKWLPVDIISHYDGFVFGWNYDLHMVFFSDKTEEFRPIRTEAERKREKAISAIDRIISSIYDQDTALSQVIYIAISAGEIPGVKLED